MHHFSRETNKLFWSLLFIYLFITRTAKEKVMSGVTDEKQKQIQMTQGSREAPITLQFGPISGPPIFVLTGLSELSSIKIKRVIMVFPLH